MRASLKNWLLLGALIFSLFALVACGGDGGGTPFVPPGDEQPGDQQPGDGQQQEPTTPVADTFAWIGNSPLAIGADRGVLVNDPAGSTVSTSDTSTTGGGTVTVNPDGSFTYRPLDGFSGTDTFTYTVAGFAPTTVTIQIDTLAWYVDNTAAAGGNGSFTSRFNTLAAAAAAAAANDTIFVFTGNGQTTGQNVGITLLAGQKLLGQGIRLSFNGVPIVDARPNAPVISNAALAAPGDIPVIELATGNEVAGLTVNAAFNEGILALGGAGHNLHDNTFTFGAGGNEGIRLLSLPESNLTGNHLINANTITGSPRDGIKLVNDELQNGAATLAPMNATVTMSRNTITGSAQDGITVNLDGTGAGAGTAVTLNILVNTITNSASVEGIDIDSLGDASVTAVVSRNTISNSNQEAIILTNAGTPGMKAFVANNDLFQNIVPDFRAVTATSAATPTFCLELVNNFNAALNTTFRVENNSGVDGAFQIFENTNDNLAVRNPLNPATRFTNILQGECNIPLDGVALFEANCAKCHTGNGLGLETKKQLIAKDITNATVDLINEQMNINGSMIQEFFDNGRLRLTQTEIAAIAAALVPTP